MANRVIWLSHPISCETPAYGGGEGMQIEPITRIAEGHTANTSRFILPNHLGTHIDGTRHFFDSGACLTNYPPEFWVFETPLLVDVSCDSNSLIRPEDLKDAIKGEPDILLIRTGYEKYRSTSRYWEQYPGLDPKLGSWLRVSHRSVRMVGVDVISISSPQHRQQGKLAHRQFLDPNGIGHEILLVEDMALSRPIQSPSKLIIAPLIIEGLDSCPCTAIGFM